MVMIDLGFIKIDASNFIAIIIGVIFFVVQLLILLKVKNLLIKLLPAILLFLACIVCLIGMLTGEGWDAIGWLLLGVFGLIYLGVCATAWITYGIVKLIKNNKKSLE